MFNSMSEMANSRENKAKQGKSSFLASYNVNWKFDRKFVQWANCVSLQILRRHVEICGVEKLVA